MRTCGARRARVANAADATAATTVRTRSVMRVERLVSRSTDCMTAIATPPLSNSPHHTTRTDICH